MNSQKQHRQSGFTILELMISTVVFSIILLVVAAGIMHFTNQYIKGINSSNTQAVARSIMTDAVQTIQFAASDPIVPPPGTQTGQVCIGNKAFDFAIGKQVVGSSQHGLIEDTQWTGNCNANFAMPTNNPTASMRELLSQGMRVGVFQVQSTPSGAWQINLTVLTGSDDLFTDSAGRVWPNAGTSFDWSTVHCKANGSQFCAVSSLSTVVDRRLAS